MFGTREPIWIGQTEMFTIKSATSKGSEIENDILESVFKIQLVRSLKSSLRWPCPPGGVEKIREKMRKLGETILLEGDTMLLVNSETSDVVGHVHLSIPSRAQLVVSKKMTLRKRKIFEEEVKEDEDVPPSPPPPADRDENISIWKNMLGFVKEKSGKVTPSPSSSSSLPPIPSPAVLTSSSLRSEHVKTRVVLLQHADGSWTWRSELTLLIGPYENAFEKDELWKGCRPLFWPTALVCAFVMSKSSDLKEIP